MAIPPGLMQTTCDIYRPFGAAGPTYTGVPCRLVADFPRSRGAAGAVPEWTHCLVVDVGVDIRDGCTRAVGSAGLTYADGDEVRVPSGAASLAMLIMEPGRLTNALSPEG